METEYAEGNGLYTIAFLNFLRGMETAQKCRGEGPVADLPKLP